MIITQFEKKVNKLVRGYLLEKGFVEERIGGFIIKHTNFEDTVSIRVVRVGLDFGIIYMCSRNYYLIENFWKDLRQKYNPQDTITTIRAYRHVIDTSIDDSKGHPILKEGGIFISGSNIDNEVAAFQRLFFYEYENLVLPFLEQTKNVKWLDEQINSVPTFAPGRKAPLEVYNPSKIIPSNGLLIKKVIVAKLAGNKEFENLQNEISSAISDLMLPDQPYEIRIRAKDILKFHEEVYDRLQDVQPLEPPFLV